MKKHILLMLSMMVLLVLQTAFTNKMPDQPMGVTRQAAPQANAAQPQADLAPASVITGVWQTVGAAGFSAGKANGLNLVMDSNNTPFVAYADNANGDKATVMKYNGTAWAGVGAADFSAGSAYYLTLAIGGGNTLFVAYADDANGKKATVMKYNGSSWVSVGPVGFTTSSAYMLKLAVGSDNIPYIAYRNMSDGFKAIVMKYTGAGSTGWTQVGTGSFNPGGDISFGLALDNGGAPYFAYADGNNGSKAVVVKYNGSAWVNVGSAGITSGEADAIHLAVAGGTTPFLLYGNAQPILIKYSGSGSTGWELYGSDELAAAQVFSIHGWAFDKDGTPYLVGEYNDPDHGSLQVVVKFNGAAWDTLGTTGLDIINDTVAGLAVDSSTGTPYLAYGDGEHNNNKATVIRYIPAPQVTTTAATGATTGSAILHGTVNPLKFNTTVTFEYGLTNAYGSSVPANPGSLTGSAATAVSASLTGLLPNSTYHYRVVGANAATTFDGADLTFTTLRAIGQTVGPAGFTSGQASAVDMVIDKNNTPYVSFSDGTKAGKLTVMKYTASGWMLVGQAGFTAADAVGLIALDSANTPYVGFSDGAHGNKPSVMKYTGNGSTGWEYVGTPGFIPSGPQNEILQSMSNLVVGKNNKVYLAGGFVIDGVEAKSEIWVYDSVSGWLYFSQGSAIALGSDDTPYKAYCAYSYGDGSSSLEIDKYTGAGLSGWTPIGYYPHCAAGPILDQNNIPYIAYSDKTDKITVEKYSGSGTTWSPVGLAGFASSSGVQMVIGHDSTPFVDFMDKDYGGKASVMKSDGTSWGYVGAPALTEDVVNTVLAVDSANTAYIAFTDSAHGNKATVLKLVAPLLALNKAGPLNAASGVPISPTLSWGASNTAANYEYCVDTTNNSACDTGWIDAGAKTNVVPSGLEKNITYYWQVQGVGASETAAADAGAWWSFTTHESSNQIFLPLTVK